MPEQAFDWHLCSPILDVLVYFPWWMIFILASHFSPFERHFFSQPVIWTDIANCPAGPSPTTCDPSPFSVAEPPALKARCGVAHRFAPVSPDPARFDSPPTKPALCAALRCR